MTYTSTQFLDSIKRLIVAPSNQRLYTDADYLAIGDRKMLDTIVPLIDSLNGDYFVYKELQTIYSDQSEYFLPTRAMARKLRDVKIQNSGGIRFDFPKIAIEREQIYQVSGIPFGFYFMGDKFVLVPTPTGASSGADTGLKIQYWYFLSPGTLIAVSDAAVVSGISGNDVTVTSLPADIVTGSIIDFIQGVSGNSSIGLDKTIANIAGNTLTFMTGDVPTTLALGDYISLSGTSPVLQIPDTAIPYFVTLTCMDVLQGLSDFEGYDRLSAIAEKQEKGVKQLLEPRIEGEATKIVNDFGLIRRTWRGNWRGNYPY